MRMREYEQLPYLLSSTEIMNVQWECHLSLNRGSKHVLVGWQLFFVLIMNWEEVHVLWYRFIRIKGLWTRRDTRMRCCNTNRQQRRICSVFSHVGYVVLWGIRRNCFLLINQWHKLELCAMCSNEMHSKLLELLHLNWQRKKYAIVLYQH